MLRKVSIALLALLISCSTQVRGPETAGQPEPEPEVTPTGESQMVLYARSTEPARLPIKWDIRKISLNRHDGSQVDLPGSAMILDTRELERGQKLLAISDVEEGRYQGLTIFTRKAFYDDTGDMLTVETNFLTISHPFSIIPGNAKTMTLLVDLADQGQPRESFEFEPLLAVEDENPRPRGKLIYVANELSSNISVIDKGLKRVVYNVFVGTNPTALGADHRRNRLYIADRRDGVIYEMDMIRQHLLKATQIEFVDEPIRIEPVPAKDLFMVVNYGSDTVYLMDSFTSQIVETIEVGDGPVNAAYSAFWGLAFVLNRIYGTVSVLNLRDEPVVVDTTLQVELEPTGLAIDDALGWLFVTNSGSTDLSIIKIETMAIEKSVTVGTGAADVVFDPTGRRIFVGMIYTNEILCIDPYTGVLAYSIKLPSRPGKLLFDPDERKLYAAVPERNAVAVIDPMARKIQDWIETGERPSSIAIRL
jgi:YVTN family beta-propeller protein